MGTWDPDALLGGPVSLLLLLVWETVFLMEALAVPGSSGEEGEGGIQGGLTAAFHGRLG